MLNNGMSVAKKRITEVTQNDDRMENLSKRLKVIQIQYNFSLIINIITRLTVVFGKFYSLFTQLIAIRKTLNIEKKSTIMA